MRIVLADDHRLFLEGLVNLLTAQGFDVVATAADGIEAVAKVEQHRPDVVLMDLRMPHRDGLAATRLIKAQRPETRIIILTTSEDDEDVFEAIRSGACGYLLKTVTGDELVEALHGLIDGVPPLSRGLAARLLAEFARAPGPPLPERPPGSVAGDLRADRATVDRRARCRSHQASVRGTAARGRWAHLQRGGRAARPQ